VHGVDQAQAFADPAFRKTGVDLRGDVDEPAPARDFEKNSLRKDFILFIPFRLDADGACPGSAGKNACFA
jgi:hypothetical protein